jgi:hypothetical protein
MSTNSESHSSTYDSPMQQEVEINYEEPIELDFLQLAMEQYNDDYFTFFNAQPL